MFWIFSKSFWGRISRLFLIYQLELFDHTFHIKHTMAINILMFLVYTHVEMFINNQKEWTYVLSTKTSLRAPWREVRLNHRRVVSFSKVLIKWTLTFLNVIPSSTNGTDYSVTIIIISRNIVQKIKHTSRIYTCSGIFDETETKIFRYEI
jgi:hypothetical protein